MSAAGAGNTALEAARRKSDVVMSTAKDAAQEAPNKVKAAADTSQDTAQRIFHKPYMKAALPFINGGLAGPQPSALSKTDSN